MSDRIYLDYAATTPIDPRVLEAMLPFLSETFGNPSSMHKEGHEARVALDAARSDIAEVLAVRPREIIMTPSATASNNLAIRGVVEQALHGDKVPHFVTSALEHKAVLLPAECLQKGGMLEVSIVQPQADGIVRVEDIVDQVQPETVLVSLMLANSELGTMQPVRELSKALRFEYPDLLLHCDAVQAAPWMDVRPEKLGVDLLTLSAHKMYGPRGAGLLYVRDGLELSPLICGGGQERGLFSGTENMAGIVGFARAFALVREERDQNVEHVEVLRDQLRAVLEELSWVSLTGSTENRLPNNIHLTLDGVEAESAVIALDREGVAVSTGSACASGGVDPSPVLRAIGYSKEKARCGLRLTLGRTTTKEEIERAAEIIPETLRKLKH